MRSDRRYIVILVLLTIMSAVLGILGNIVSNLLPMVMTPYLWLSAPIFVALLLITLLLTIWQVRLEHDTKEGVKAGRTSDQKQTGQPSSPGDVETEKGGYVSGHREDWGEASSVEEFYGRLEEMAELKQRILHDHSRVVALVGFGGVGKTSLAVRLSRDIKDNFDCVMWRTLRNAPPFKDLISECIRILSGHRETNLGDSSDGLISTLINYLRAHHCLLILDNFESILEDDQNAGECREGYEGYCQLISSVGEASHQSCLLLTTREKPKVLTALEGPLNRVHIFSVHGLSNDASKQLLNARQLSGKVEAWSKLVQSYKGNPLALRLVSATIKGLYLGDIDRFLEQGALVFGQIQDVLEVQVNRLSDLEREIMFWLAIEREWVTLDVLQEDIIQPLSKAELLSSLLSLRRRSIIEESNISGFTLQPVVMEYLTEKFIKEIREEVLSERPVLLNRHSLVKALTKDYIREAQVRVILQPLAQSLVNKLGATELKRKLLRVVSSEKAQSSSSLGYLGGNALNLLCKINADLSGLDFAGMTIWQAYLRDVNLHNVDFSGANLARSTFTEAFGSILAVSFSRDGNHLAAGTASNDVRIWQVANGKQVVICRGHLDWVRAVDFSLDNRLIASASEDQTVRVWDAQTGDCLFVFSGHTGRVRSLAFSPLGKFLASGSEDTTIRFWDTETGQPTQTLLGHAGPIRGIAFSPNGTLIASSSGDQTVRLWNVKTGECLHTLRGHQYQVWSVDFSPDNGKVASGGEDGTVRLWSAETADLLHTLRGHSGAIRSVAFDYTGQFVASGSEDHTIRIWNTDTEECMQTLYQHTNRVRAVDFSPVDQTLASGGEDQTVRLWDTGIGQCTHLFQGYINRVWSIAFSPDKRSLANGSDDKTIKIWDLETGDVLRTLYGHTNQVRAVVYSLDGRHLISGSDDHSIRLWDVASGRCLQTLLTHTNRVSSVAISPDGSTFVSGSDDQTVCLWSIGSARPIRVLRGHTGWVWSVAFSPDGTTLVSGSEDGTTRVWNVASGECVLTLHTGRVWMLACNPSNKIIATGCDDRVIRLWSSETGECIKVLEGHDGRGVWAVDFSPDGLLLASGGDDQTVKLWDVANATCLATLQKHTLRLRSVKFSPDGKSLATAGDDESIILSDVGTRTYIRTLKSIRPYEGLNITGATGLTDAQKDTLIALGAVDHS